jgi:prepilin-type N-terminal cleavage/methylation domain-containing protein
LKRIASRRRRKPEVDPEAGFTLTELIVGLLIASMLIVGLVELTRRFAQTSGDVRETVADTRANRSIDGLFALLARADPGELVVGPDRVEARLGSLEINVRLQASSNGVVLDWQSPDLQRSIALPAGARFEQLPSGLILLRAPSSPAPIGMIRPERELPFDCQFGTVTLECRQ